MSSVPHLSPVCTVASPEFTGEVLDGHYIPGCYGRGPVVSPVVVPRSFAPSFWLGCSHQGRVRVPLAGARSLPFLFVSLVRRFS
jgi:hypothetical protein